MDQPLLKSKETRGDGPFELNAGDCQKLRAREQQCQVALPPN
jgi:hypothetical protein